MRILFVWTAAEFSTRDVAVGYHDALRELGHEIIDYRLSRRFLYHAKALGEPLNQNIGLVSKLASEDVLAKALWFNVDRVLIISGLTFHPQGLWLLRRCGIPTTTIFTESPYDDEDQKEFADIYPEMNCATQERISAEQFGWTYLRPAYHPKVHRPYEPCDDYACDVLMVGTGWKERVELLSRIDWRGINLRLFGTWNAGVNKCPDNLLPFIQADIVKNDEAAKMYSSARICLNMHRAHPHAESVNPRAVELAACGAFQLSDHRAELQDIFGCSVPTFSMDDPKDLEQQIRYYLAHDKERGHLVGEARKCVRNETFTDRAKVLLSTM